MDFMRMGSDILISENDFKALLRKEYSKGRDEGYAQGMKDSKVKGGYDAGYKACQRDMVQSYEAFLKTFGFDSKGGHNDKQY